MTSRKNNIRILIVDDNNDLLSALRLFLTPHAGEVSILRNPNLIPSTLQQKNFDLVLLDMNYTAGIHNGNEGLYWMKRIHEMDPLIAVIMITGYGDIELAVQAVKEGATDFIQKSWDEEKILSSVLSALKVRESQMELHALSNKKKHLETVIASETTWCPCPSSAMAGISKLINKVACTDANILILGENGTGKEIVARQIHALSARSSELFVAVDLASLSETLFESELFGYKKGAFTDAKTDKSGFIELADKGTLFLDEIGNLSLPMQTKILSLLQNREFTALGSVRKTSVDIRLVAATNKDLHSMVEEGSFRQDLLYRMNTIQIKIPPLRERPEDIPALARFFLNKYSERYGKKLEPAAPAVMKKICAQPWPGNIRELQHAMEKAVILASGNEINADDFITDQYRKSFEPESFNLAENEKHLISKAIEKHRGNMSHTARSLGINRSTLYEKIRRYGL